MHEERLEFQIGGPHSEMRLDHYLRQALSDRLKEAISQSRVRTLILAGAVFLNGKQIRIPSRILSENARVSVLLNRSKWKKTAHIFDFEFSSDRILFEDEWLLVVDKPPGIPTQPTVDKNRSNLFDALKELLKKREPASDPYLGLHHRLDRDTSGVILFTKAKSVNQAVGELFHKHRIQKTYWALCRISTGIKIPRTEWVVRNFLGKVSKKGKSAQYGAVRSGGDYAETGFRVMRRWTDPSGHEWILIEARPKTGRTHQIRVHLSELGLPILGDALYGTDQNPVHGRLRLHAARLEFVHPISRQPIVIESPLPQDFGLRTELKSS